MIPQSSEHHGVPTFRLPLNLPPCQFTETTLRLCTLPIFQPFPMTSPNHIKRQRREKRRFSACAEKGDGLGRAIKRELIGIMNDGLFSLLRSRELKRF